MIYLPGFTTVLLQLSLLKQGSSTGAFSDSLYSSEENDDVEVLLAQNKPPLNPDKEARVLAAKRRRDEDSNRDTRLSGHQLHPLAQCSTKESLMTLRTIASRHRKLFW